MLSEIPFFPILLIVSFVQYSNGELNLPKVIWLGGIVPYRIDKDFESIITHYYKISSELNPFHSNVKSDSARKYDQILEKLKGSLQRLEKSDDDGQRFVLTNSRDKLSKSPGSSSNKQLFSPHNLYSELQTTSHLPKDIILYPSLAITMPSVATEFSEQTNKNDKTLTEQPTLQSAFGTSLIDNFAHKESLLRDDPGTEQNNLRISPVVIDKFSESGQQFDPSLITTRLSRTIDEISEITDPFASTDNHVSLPTDSTTILSPNRVPLGAQPTDVPLAKMQSDISHEGVVNPKCSQLQTLLKPTKGSQSPFEQALKNSSKTWSQGQKIGLGKLLRRVRIVIGLYRNNPPRQFEIVKNIIKLYIEREPDNYKESVLDLAIDDWGSLREFILCSL
ncbi:unnamed protein product [Dracunculus medinensis]|uniref:Uncharacterized protein n=1 Tax=Dracunculus medinensis TaxID=318479 RepID=A0A0N4U225_DRAME|nr:unnamed protein product [Dracunculus medinensis]